MNKSSMSVIGVDLGGTNVRAGLVVDGKVVKHAASKVPEAKTDPEPIIQKIKEVIHEVFNDEVVGIGFGLPGVMDKKQGVIKEITNIPCFLNIPIKQILSSEFNVPVFIDNDVNCFVLGEKFYGAGIKFRNVVGLSLGTGMGTGIINANHLLEDANSGSGEFGEVPYLDANLEAYCSGAFFKRVLGMKGEEAFNQASAGNVEVLNAYKEFGMHLGKAIHIILLAFDPEAIIIGGSAAQSRQFFHDAMMEEVNRFVFSNSLKNLTISYAQEENSPILGASKLVEP